jgi:serine acetyltransferase
MSALSACVAGGKKFVASVEADRRSLSDFQDRYNTDRQPLGSLVSDAIQKIGFQMLIWVRLMQLAADLHVPLLPQIISRLIRHLFGAEIHWHAAIAPGITVVHGNGLVISHGATVGEGCLLFQNVTLGESMDPATGVQGAPQLGRNVHVMPNAVVIGPISVGEGSKIGANVTLASSIPARTSVRNSDAVFSQRKSSPADTFQ